VGKTEPEPPISRVPPVVQSAKREQPRTLTTKEVVEKTEASVALVKGNHGCGSGFLVGPGLVATNSHVVRREALQNLEVYFPSAAEKSRGPSGASLVLCHSLILG
jgi:hypothetical protein